MPRFVILIHDHPFLHWDFLLEDGDRCRTWRFLENPERILSDFIAQALPNHRLMYLDYEGPVSGNRGTVHRWDVGRFEWEINQPEVCKVQLFGEKWRGMVRLLASSPNESVDSEYPADRWFGLRES